MLRERRRVLECHVVKSDLFLQFDADTYLCVR